MLATLPAPVTSSHVMESPSEARKRRRAILSSSRAATTTAQRSSLVSDDDTDDSAPPPKKKPQLKYDPDVPMTKEEAAVWRREQRRQRNRLSAALSRQRQRNHITELEGEVQEWKTKYEAVMAKIQAMEQQQQRSVSPVPSSTTNSTTVPSPTSSAMFPDVLALEENLKLPLNDTSESETMKNAPEAAAAKDQQQQPSKMISRPATSRITHLLLWVCGHRRHDICFSLTTA